MSIQEIFNKVASHLLQQNARSLNGKGICYYRGEEGLKCAVGILIPDCLYNENLEGVRVDSFSVLGCLLKAGVLETIYPSNYCDEKKIALLMLLQTIHDKSTVLDWKDELKLLAEQANLDSSILDNYNGEPIISIFASEDITFTMMMTNLIKKVPQPAAPVPTPTLVVATKEGVTA
jgi:hypothetical protein